MSKKATARTKAPERRTLGTPDITDPHLTALLSFMSGEFKDPDGIIALRFSRAHASARTMLSSLPLTVRVW